MKFILTTTFLLFATYIFCQQKLSKEFSFITDNDLYVSFEKDQYYTNGLFLSYRSLAKNFGSLTKKIYEFQIGHELYTPFRPDVSSVRGHDRPFAGYLYGSFGIVRVYQKNSILKTSFQLGIVGEDAFGEELQNFIHDVSNFKTPNGWKYQIRNMLAVNIDTEYILPLGTNESKISDINLSTKLRLGTIFNEATLGFMGRFGFKELQPLNNSIAVNTHLNNEKTKTSRGVESFIFYKPSLTYVIRDATIEGSLFNNNSPVTFQPKSFRFDLEIGYQFTANKWVFGYSYHFHTNKLSNLRNDNGNDYGRIHFGYLFN